MKKLGVLFMVFVALAVFVYYYEFVGQEGREEAKKREESLFRIKQDEITAVEVIRSQSQSIIFKKQGERWVIKQPVDTLADSTTVDSLLRNIEEAKIDRTFKDGGQRAQEYGLKNPRLTLKVITSTDEKILRVGNDDYSATKVYVQHEGGPEVYLTSDSILTMADKDLMDWRNKKVLLFNRYKVQTIQIEREMGRLELKKENDKWRIENPLAEPADQSAVTGLLSSLEFAEAQKFITEQAVDLGSYGLNKPKIVVRLQQESQDSWKELELGKQQESGYLARNPDRSVVFTVKEEVYEKLSQGIWEFRDKDVVDVSQNDIKRFIIRRGSEKIILKEEDFKWTIEKPDSHQGKEVLSHKFWYPIDDIKFESIDEGPSEKFPQPEIQITIHLKEENSTSRSFDFAKEGEEYWARKVKSGRRGRISKESFEKLQFTVEDIVSES